MLFVIRCLDKPDHLAVRKANREAHLAHARTHADRIRMAGPLLDGDGETMIGSLFLIDLPDRAAAEAFCRDDPYARAGLFERVDIHPFRQVLPEG